MAKQGSEDQTVGRYQLESREDVAGVESCVSVASELVQQLTPPCGCKLGFHDEDRLTWGCQPPT